MSAIDIIRQCQSAGILLQVRGERLHVEAPAGSLTPAIKQSLADYKTDLLALHAIRKRLRTLATSMGIPRTIVDELPIEELQASASQAASCEGRLDGNGNPLGQSLLTFYLRRLAEGVNA